MLCLCAMMLKKKITILAKADTIKPKLHTLATSYSLECALQIQVKEKDSKSDLCGYTYHHKIKKWLNSIQSVDRLLRKGA